MKSIKVRSYSRKEKIRQLKKVNLAKVALERAKNNEKSLLRIRNLRSHQTVIAKLSGRQTMKIAKKVWNRSFKGKIKRAVLLKIAFSKKRKERGSRRVAQVISKRILIKIL